MLARVSLIVLYIAAVAGQMEKFCAMARDREAVSRFFVSRQYVYTCVCVGKHVAARLPRCVTAISARMGEVGCCVCRWQIIGWCGRF